VKTPEWIVNTDGSNLSEVLAIKEVDNTKTYSNDLLEIYRTFGVEAARELLIREINEVVESSGAYVNYRHVSLLADAMTNKGNIMPITRHGINKSDRGALAKCSFEETSDILIKAAVFGELDNMNGVSGNIMFGQEVHVGTGAVELLYDEEFMLQDGDALDDIELKSEEFFENYCTEDRLDFNTENVQKIAEKLNNNPENSIILPIIELSDEDDSDSD
jgi:DNA-directed RNA polymerase II subunit RPB1